MNSFNLLHPDLALVKQLLYDRQGLTVTDLQLHDEGQAYGASSFRINGKLIEHRVSKITPTKTGQFVTIWKRNSDGITQPFDLSDDFDLVIITSKEHDQLGQFIFSKQVLSEKGVISVKGKGGKRGIRVYPPWIKTESKQAAETQKWQGRSFLEITGNNKELILENIKRLF